MAKIFYHGICNFISRLRISRFIIRRVTRFEFLKKRTLRRGPPPPPPPKKQLYLDTCGLALTDPDKQGERDAFLLNPKHILASLPC